VRVDTRGIPFYIDYFIDYGKLEFIDLLTVQDDVLNWKTSYFRNVQTTSPIDSHEQSTLQFVCSGSEISSNDMNSYCNETDIIDHRKFSQITYFCQNEILPNPRGLFASSSSHVIGYFPEMEINQRWTEDSLERLGGLRHLRMLKFGNFFNEEFVIFSFQVPTFLRINWFI